MRRRRRRRWYWLPNRGIAGASGAVDQTEKTSADFLVVNLNTNGTVATAIDSVTFDNPQDTSLAGAGADQPMADFLRNAYMLRRIVGNVFVHPIVASAAEGYAGVFCTFGMLVARADEIADGAIPIGTFTQAEINQNYGPQHTDNVREPYIFRRSWILSTPRQDANVGPEHFPATNAGYGSAYEGTFVDQKTLRRIDGDNRLWAVFSARTYPVGSAHSATVSYTAFFDFRYLARPTSTAKSGAF